MQPTVLQILPELDCGGVERGTLDVAAELVRQNYRSIVVSGPGRLVPELISNGSEHFKLHVGKKSIFSARLIPVLRKLFVEQHVNIVHARSRLPAWLAYLAIQNIAQESRPVFITTVHGPYSVNRYSKVMTKGKRVIAISKYIKNYIIQNYSDVDQTKIEVVHRGISKSKYPYNYKPSAQWLDAWRNEYPELINKMIITLPARITRWKGHNDFIEIITKARKTGLNVHGLVAGGADAKKQGFLNELKTLIARNNMDENFTFIGHRDDMREIMSISDVVLSLAKIPEAFGRTALEALSLGTPVIAYDHGGAAEVLSEMFPTGKANPLDIDHVVTLLNQFSQSMPRVEDKDVFTLSNMLEKTISIYNSTL